MLNAERINAPPNNWSHNSSDRVEGLFEVSAPASEIPAEPRMVGHMGWAATSSISLTAGHHTQSKEEEPVKPEFEARKELTETRQPAPVKNPNKIPFL